MMLPNKNNYGSARNTANIKYIVIHYTANNGDTALNNLKYFANNVTKSSAHYFVDSKGWEQSVPDNYVAWHCGGTKYKNGGGTFYGKCTNSNSIGIEICDDDKKGVIKPNQTTINNAIKLTQQLMKKYNIPQSNVIRHYDVTGKQCPAYWVDNNLWKSEFHNKLTSQVTSPQANQSNSNKVEEKSFLVKIKVDSLNVRKGAGTQYGIVTTVKKGQLYTIVATSGDWGKLKSGAGWISINPAYVTRQ